jgi:hypothetical protein
MHRSQQRAFQRGKDTCLSLARNIILFGDQVDQRGLGEGLVDGTKQRCFGLADF